MRNTYRAGDLSPAEQKRLDQETRASLSRKERALLDDYQSEITVDTNEDAEEPHITANGKIRRFTRPKKSQHKKMMDALSHDFGIGGLTAVLKENFGNAVELLRAIAATPHTGAPYKTAQGQNQAINPLYAYEDNNMAFETMKVSFATAAEIERQSQIINAKVEEMEAATHLDRKHLLGKQILVLAEEFQMRQHPKTLIFVHEVEAVEAMEAKYNPDGGEMVCNAEVCVVRMKCTADEARKIKRTIADVFNSDPAEVQLNQQERIEVAHAQPLPPPRLEHV